MAYVMSNGARLHVQQVAAAGEGPAPTVVFVHGLGMDTMASFYFTLAAPMSEAGANVVTYDLRGHGRSEKTHTGYKLSDSADDLIGLLDALDITEPVHLVGNSYGGCIAFNVAVAQPWRVASITLVESMPAFGENWSAGIAYLFTGVLDSDDEASRTHMQSVREEILSQSNVPDGARVDHMMKLSTKTIRETGIAAEVPWCEPLTEDEVRSVSCPVLAIFGGRSWMISLAPVLEEMVPHSRIEVIDGLGHFILAEATKQVYDLLAEWVFQPSLV